MEFDSKLENIKTGVYIDEFVSLLYRIKCLDGDTYWDAREKLSHKYYK